MQAEGNKSKTGFYVFAGIVVVCISWFAWHHFEAGFSFPIPWEDEAVFILQGKAIAEHGTMLAPSMNPERSIEWMPPGYMVFLSALFHIDGNPLVIARTGSLFLLIITFITFAAAARTRERHALFLLLFIGVCFANRHFLILGNTARMESLIMACVGVSFLLFSYNKPAAALGVLALTPIIHPNGFYFLLASCIYLFVTRKQQRLELSKLTGFFLLIVLILWVLYVLYLSQHWNDVIHDLTMQMRRKGARNFFKPFLRPRMIVLFSGIAIAGIYALIKRDKWLLLLAAFAMASWFINRIGQEMWYDIYDQFAMMLVLLSVLSWASSFRSNIPAVAACVIVFFAGREIGVVENPALYPRKFDWKEMKMSDNVPYITKEDVSFIRNYIHDAFPQRNNIRVKFEPKGDALFFHEKEDSRIETIHAHPETTIFAAQSHDLYIVHVSKYQPSVWKKYPIGWACENAGIDTTDRRYELLRRDGTEVWYSSIPMK